MDLNAKVIVLDGTADIHPNYQQDYIDLRDGSKFSRGLDNLVLRFVSGIGTSKSQLADDEERIHLVHNYIRNLHPNKRIAAFTHNTAENNLRKYFATTAHFGDIKGKNDFRDYTCIAQLGHNRFPEYFYLTWFLWKNSEQLQALSGLSLEETSAYISELQKSPEYKNTVDRFLLADLEQNMFRSAIRQPDFVDPVHCYVFCNTDHYESLIREAQSRYSLLEASVEPVDASKSFEAERIENIPPEERTIAQRMIAVINAYTIGTEFTTRANPVKGRKCRMLLIDAGIDAKQYARAREKSSQLRKILEDMQTTRGYYVKK